MPAPTWQALFRYQPKDTYKNVYNRAYRQIVLAKKLSPSSEPALRKALANAKAYFDSKQKKKSMLPYRNGGKASNKNVSAFLAAARR
jgi:O6-methylguanine-DNA--protein-cysteine methyltransferase